MLDTFCKIKQIEKVELNRESYNDRQIYIILLQDFKAIALTVFLKKYTEQ